MLAERIWRTGLAAWEHYPWFGVGMSKYSLIEPEGLAPARARRPDGRSSSSAISEARTATTCT
ncbi:MAG: hypothetical protein RML56_06960 [Burkholderiales bacterium]|nr:hypothetical protein [Burkholderiales bacterium]